MKTMIRIFGFCVTLLPLMVNSFESLSRIAERVNEISKKGGIINGVFVPSENGYINSGKSGFAYKGIMHANKIEVAVKFTLTMAGFDAKHEYEMYSYLNAINNTDIERYGIPCIYYYGQWEECQMIAMSLLSSEFNAKYYYLNVTEIDVMILCREFVRISKYIHSRGICHNDIHSGNVMFRGQQGFIIDYNVATKMYESGSEKPETDCLQHDWNKFYSMLLLYRNTLEWDEFQKKMVSMDRKRLTLKGIYREIARNVFHATIPDYDGLYKMINDEIARWWPALVSWLKPEERMQKIIHDATQKTFPSITDMKIPTQMTDIHYPVVKYDYFG